MVICVSIGIDLIKPSYFSSDLIGSVIGDKLLSTFTYIACIFFALNDESMHFLLMSSLSYFHVKGCLAVSGSLLDDRWF